MRRFLHAMFAVGCGLLLGAGEADPLSVLEKPKAPLSPSTQRGGPDLSDAIEKGYRFLDKWQNPNGSWDRIGEIDQMQEDDWDLPYRIKDEKEYRDDIVKDLPETKYTEHVADTALAGRQMLAAVTSGLHPEYEPKVKKSILFLCDQVQKWNGGDKVRTIYIQDRFFDPLHDKTPALGSPRYYDATVDTFFTLSFLAQAREAVTDEHLRQRIDRALAVLKFKIESTQTLPGTWEDNTDPTAKLNDKIDMKGVELPEMKDLTTLIPTPLHPRIAPDNPKLPKNVIAKAEHYDEDRRNILVHCQYVRDISMAARLGVDFKMETLLRSASYLRNSFDEERWEAAGDGPYVKRVSPRAVLLASVVAAWYQADLTAQARVEDLKKRGEAGDKDAAAALPLAQKHAADLRKDLERQVRRFIRYDNLPITGPSLENLVDCMKAVAMFDAAKAKEMEGRLVTPLLGRQRSEGNFIAGANDNWVYYEWIGTDRGESIFGTSTTLEILMYLQKDQKAASIGDAGGKKK